MTCPITADRDEFRGAVTEREAALVEALKQIAFWPEGMTDFNAPLGMARAKANAAEKALRKYRRLARAHTAAEGERPDA